MVTMSTLGMGLEVALSRQQQGLLYSQSFLIPKLASRDMKARWNVILSLVFPGLRLKKSKMMHDFRKKAHKKTIGFNMQDIQP